MNRLGSESSPYLRQHADNPVDWYPWGPEAFASAVERDVPVLLSVGYSACHWCHVMAHESFEDAETAAVMNQYFVNVKVDREERPDVDAIYMEAVQAMTGRGGWPMTVVMTPDGRPFFGGTYFPPERRGNTPSFVELLGAINDAWTQRRDDLVAQSDQLTESLGRSGKLEPSTIPDATVLDDAYGNLKARHDDVSGGFGSAPKFPSPQNLDYLIRTLARTGSPITEAMVLRSLDAMASGGVYDHLGGGFARYSVDDRWTIPHFEKMLYDQAGLVRLYTHGFQVTRQERYRQVVEETIDYVLRDLRLPDGGVASAEDADSEGVEGKFYVFTPDEVRSVIADPTVANATIAHYEFDMSPNFEGAWVPMRLRHQGDWARDAGVDEGRRLLLEHRSARIRPGLDDKVLTEWNAMWIGALAEAGAVFGRHDWLEAASDDAQFLLANLRRPDGRWLRSHQATSGAKTLAFAADHAALVDAFTRLGEATGRAMWTVHAVEVARAMLDLFWDDDNGGLFTTGHDGERLVARDKDVQDNALPSANSTAAVALFRLSSIVGKSIYADRARDILALLGRLAGETPTGFGVLLQALDLHHRGITEVLVVDRNDLVKAVQEQYLPNAVLAWGERTDSGLWEGRTDAAAYVCKNQACGLPATTIEELEAQLRAG